MILDGKSLSIKLKNELKSEVSTIVEKYQKTPTVAIVLVGDNPASEIYVRNKIKAASYTGIKAVLVKEEDNITMEHLLNIVEDLNNNPDINGIIVQLPLPDGLDEQKIINTINPLKDVDGFGLLNKGKLFCGLSCLKSATPYGIMRLLKAYEISLKGKNAVVIGRSNIVGKPMAIMLLDENATVTIAHSKTTNLKEVCQNADILVVAIGKPKFITADMVKEGSVIIDVGINRDNGILCGDVDFENVQSKAAYITPVPGGVGPLTIVSLLENTVKAFIEQNTNN